MRSIATFSLAAGAGLLLAIAVPLSASAHVTVAPNAAAAGSYALVTVKVPNESATAVTNKVELDLPADTPFSSVSYVPVAGWTAELVKETLPSPVKVGDNEITEAVTKIVWTADPGSEISAGQLQLFPVSLGPVPDVDRLVLAAQQSYSDGTVVSWSETGTSAEHPAPILYVNETPAADHHAGGGDDDHAGSDSAGDATGATAAASDAVARGLGIGGLVLGTVGTVFAVIALRRRSGASDHA
jgi:Uncharacterized protein conserved in bacteria